MGEDSNANGFDEQSEGQDSDGQLSQSDDNKAKAKAKAKGKAKNKKSHKERNDAKKVSAASRGAKAIKGGYRDCNDCGQSKPLTDFRSGSAVCTYPCQRVIENVRKAC